MTMEDGSTHPPSLSLLMTTARSITRTSTGGIVDDDMRFHPNSTYFYAPIEERRKLIFPAEWDLSEIKALSGTGHRGAVEYEGGDLDRMYGPTWFLDNVARETGLTDDLRKVFDGNMEMAQDALTLAYYLFLESRTYSHIGKWQRVVKTPSVHTLTSGFFASKTLGLDLDPMEAKSRYGMRDEQGKTFMLQKGPLGRRPAEGMYGVFQAWKDVHLFCGPDTRIIHQAHPRH